MNTTDVESLSKKQYQSHTKKVFITENSFPKETYDEIAIIDVGTTWYGSDDKVKQMMADKARKIGANAVIEVTTWHQPSGFSWAAPHGKGKAVKFIDDNFINNLPKDNGWF